MNFPFELPGGPAVVISFFGVVPGGLVNAPYLPVVVPEIQAPPLVQAVIKRAMGSVLADLLPGGIYFGPADEEADDNPPYCSIVWGSQRSDYVAGPIRPRKSTIWTTLRIRLVGPDYQALEDVYKNWCGDEGQVEEYPGVFAPDMEPLAIKDRRFAGIFNGEPMVDIGVNTPGDPLGYNAIMLSWEMEIVTSTR